MNTASTCVDHHSPFPPDITSVLKDKTFNNLEEDDNISNTNSTRISEVGRRPSRASFTDHGTTDSSSVSSPLTSSDELLSRHEINSLIDKDFVCPSIFPTTDSFFDTLLTTATRQDILQIEPIILGNLESDDEFGEDTEHIDYAALKGHLKLFMPGPNDDISDNTNGKYVFYSSKTGLLRHHVLRELGVGMRNLSNLMRSGPFWLDICDPGKDELFALSEVFKIHTLTLEGLQCEGEEIREKCDVFEKYSFICIRAFEADSSSTDYMRPINFYMLVSPSCVVTIHREPLEFSHTIAKRMRLLTARTGLTSDWIVYTILEDVLEMFNPSVRDIELEIDAIDDLVASYSSSKIHTPSQPDLLGRIAAARKRVTQLIRLMSAKSELLRVIAKRCSSRFSDDAHLYLRDLQDHTAMVDQTLHHYDESLNRSHSNYLAHISIEISATSNKMSEVMKKLTAVSTMTLPWCVITGLMSMNIYVPGSGTYDSESLVPWFLYLLVMIVASILVYIVGRRRDWF